MGDSDNSRWVWVCVQHPMPLLVEDRGVPTVLERIPPWGDPSLKEYVRKFGDVFDSVEEHPDFRIDFETSARELEDVAKESPETVARMRRLVEEGRVGIVGGDYSQAHYHVYGPESCIKQIEIGLSVFREILGVNVTVFFHQETGLHEQLPQILRAFGYTVAVPPRFPYAIRFTSSDSPELTGHFGVVEYVRGDDFTNWTGKDGTAIPLYLSMGAPSVSSEIIEVFQKHGSKKVKADLFDGPSPFDRFMAREHHKMPVTVPKILIENPDMKRITDEYYQERVKLCRFDLLENALSDRLAEHRPVGTASLYAYWSYIEGVWAEQLLRANYCSRIGGIHGRRGRRNEIFPARHGAG